QGIVVVLESAIGSTDMGSYMVEIVVVNYNEVTHYIVCDNERIGTGTFDLDSKISEITDGIPGNLNVTFHPTQDDADNNTGAITCLHDAVNEVLVYVRITDDNECYDTYIMTLELEQGPDVPNLPVSEECGLNGVAQFDLPSRTNTMLAGLNNATATYFEDVNEAYDETSKNEITDPAAFENTTVDAQTISVRVQEDGSSCFTVLELPLEVMPRPVVYTGIPSYAICEIADDEAIFDLTSVGVVDNPGDFDISYYLSSDDARLPQDPIDVNDLDAYT